MADPTDPSPEVRPLAAAEWDDLAAVFGTRGDPAWCWCQFFVTTGEAYARPPARGEQNRAALRSQVQGASRPLGVLARIGDEPVGWLALGPRVGYPRLTGNRALQTVAGDDMDDENVWATTCFVVKVGRRRAGVSAALLRGGIDLAAANGARVLEGHPVDLTGRETTAGGATLYHGVASTFLDAGFREVGRTRANRPVLRLDLPTRG